MTTRGHWQAAGRGGVVVDLAAVAGTLGHDLAGSLLVALVLDQPFGEGDYGSWVIPRDFGMVTQGEICRPLSRRSRARSKTLEGSHDTQAQTVSW